MDELHSLHPNGLFLRREAIDRGYRDRDLVEARRHGQLTRVRHGAYVRRDTWQEVDAVGQHRLRAQAVLLTHDNRVALSHVSGAVEHGLRIWDQDLSKIHVTRLDAHSGRRNSDVVYHEADGHPDRLHSEGGQLVLPPAECALGAASLSTVQAGLVVLDSVLDLGLGDEESLKSAYAARAGWPHSRKLQITLRLTRQGAESVAESLTRYLMWSQHLPEPVLQFKVYDPLGRLVGITDFAWPDLRLLGEFDGRIKYHRLLAEGERPEDVVIREKNRENLLRELTGFAMIRYVWSDLYKAERTAARTRRLMTASAA